MAVASKFTIDFEYVEFGNQFALTQENDDTNMSNLSHVITFSNSYGDKLTYTLSKGDISFDVLIPYEWMLHIPDTNKMIVDYKIVTKCSSWSSSKTRTGYFYAYGKTYDNAELEPVITQVICERIPSFPSTVDWPFYIPNYDGIKLKVMAETKYGSTLSHLYVFGDSYSIAEDGTCTIDRLIDLDGSFTLYVYDSRGYSADVKLTVPIVQYDFPNCINSLYYRCLQDGTIDDSGSYAAFSASIEYSPCTFDLAEYNSIESILYYRKSGEQNWTRVGLYSDGEITIFGDGLLESDYSYDLKLTIRDTLNSKDFFFSIPTTQYSLFIKQGGNAVGLGTATNKSDAVVISPNWSLYHGDVNLMQRIYNENFNLLDNSDFLHCIDQSHRGIIVEDIDPTNPDSTLTFPYYRDGPSFAADRWWIDPDSAGKAVSRSYKTNGDSFDQRQEPEYISYVVIEKGSIIHQKVDERLVSMFDTLTPFIETVSGKASISYDSDAHLITITGEENDSISGEIQLKWAALYPGEFRECPMYYPKSYTIELLNCRRYFQEIRLDNELVPGIVGADKKTVTIRIPLQIPMAGDIYPLYPSYGSVNVYNGSGSCAEAYFSKYDGGFSISSSSNCTCAIIELTMSEDVGTENSIVFLHLDGCLYQYTSVEYE